MLRDSARKSLGHLEKPNFSPRKRPHPFDSAHAMDAKKRFFEVPLICLLALGVRFYLLPGSAVFTVEAITGMGHTTLFLWILCVYTAGSAAFFGYGMVARWIRGRIPSHSVSLCRYAPVRLLMSDIATFLRL